MTQPKISVIIVYNDEANLYECVHNVLFQTFSNIEVICVNNGGNEQAENIVKELEKDTNKMKLLSLPLGKDIEAAKRAGLSVAIGEYVIFLENNDILPSEYLKEHYLSIQKENKVALKSKQLYRRMFVENDREITELIDNRYETEMARYSEYTEDMRQKLLNEFEKFNRNSVENLKNNTYDILTRFNSLEKEFYSKEWKNKEILKTVEHSILSEINTKVDKLRKELNEVRDYIDTELKKREEETEAKFKRIETIRMEIESITANASDDAVNSIKDIVDSNDDRFKKLEKEIILRYVNLKRIMDLQFDEIREKMNGG